MRQCCLRRICWIAVLLALTAVHGRAPRESPVVEATCAKSFGRCSGGDLGSRVKDCCEATHHCVKKNTFYAQCRPKSDPFPAAWPNAKILTSGSSHETQNSHENQVSRAPEPTSAIEPNPVSAVSGFSPGPHSCGSPYMQTAQHSCGNDCALPSGDLMLDSADACLAACEADTDCHCAMFDSGHCSLLWTPCNSAILNMTNSTRSAATALQPCVQFPVTSIATIQSDSKYANCKPMQVHHGHIVSKAGCSGSCKATITSPVHDLDSCINACLKAGYGKCQSVQFKQSGTFGLDQNECTMFSIGVKYMGAHATAQVLATEGLGAAVADFCEPPHALAQFPINSVPDFGVDWDTACMGVEVAVVPGMQMGCAACAFIPDNRVERVSDSLDEYHFESDSIDDCMADCESHPNCGCAFFRVDDRPQPSRRGWCALTTAECSDPVVGAQVDYTRMRSAISKCSYKASAETMARWPDEPYDGIDWFAEWEDVCAYPEPFTYVHKNTFCGPECIVPGTHTSLESSKDACSSRCAAVSGCACSYFQDSTGYCTLMSGEVDGSANGYSSSCKNWDHIPGAMHLDDNIKTENQVTLLCSK